MTRAAATESPSGRRRRPARRTRVLPASGEQRPVFLDPAGTRWRHLRRAGLATLLVLLALGALAGPKLIAPPALDGAPVPDGPTAAEVGRAPVVGTGPLVRVVRLLREDGATYAEEPFTGERLTALSPQDATRAAGSDHALQRYGYGFAATRTISLTFDDGPDPVWTPRLLDLLSAYGVPATFFVTGEQIARYPEIVQRIVREGHAIGNHSLTHVDANSAAPFRQQVELSLTDRALRAQTGLRSSYYRLPFEGDDEASMQGDVPGILRAQQLGYAVASHDFDTLDWAYSSGERQGEIPLPPLGEQDDITMLLHDAGGGDRTRTLAYVEQLVPLARDAGYTFHTMPQVQPELAERTGAVEPTVWDRLALALAVALFALPSSLLTGLFALALVSTLGIGLVNVVLASWRARRGPPVTTATPPVAVLIAAYNEEVVIARTLEHVLASGYPVERVVVVDDGSTDATAERVREIAARNPRVRLLQQTNAGKWAALNRGFAAIDQPFVVTLDADTLITPTTVAHLMSRFHSPAVGAVAGVIKVGNHARNVLTRWQALEYLTQIGVDRAAAAALDAIMVVPGACAAWRTSAVRQAGGYSDATLAEDCDLTLMLHQHGWRVEQADEAVAFTEAPETVDALLRQRVRWMFGTLQATWRHRDMLLRPRHGWLGMVVMPLSVLTVVVPLVFTPLVTVVLLQMLTRQGPLAVLGLFALFSLLYGVVALVAVRLLHERASHLLMVPLYRLIYEPLRAYLLYACLGTALRGVRLGWNKLARTAHMDEAVPLPVGQLVPSPATPPALTPVAAS